MGLFPFLKSSYGKPLYAKVTTMDADLDRIEIESDWTGRQLFDTVCRIIGLREIWFFGLQFTNKKSIPCWLQMDKKISKQDVSKSEDGVLQFLFLVKFYPEDVEEELIQDLTRHLFFVQLKEAILSMELYCSAEASVLLASYAVQAIHGDCSEDVKLELDKLLPLSVIQQFDMSPQMWTERIKRWWTNNHGQTREEAEMEYLRVAQDLEMYGIQYYPICNKKETDLHLGVSAQGIGIYKGSNRINPRPFFSWNEIKNIQFKNKKFSMKTLDKSEISFRAQDASINMSILELCIGTHNLYLRRRQPDLLEVQQMRAQANEQRLRRQHEQAMLVEERGDRVQAELERDHLKEEIALLNEQLNVAKEAVRKTEESAEIMAEKARQSEKEAIMMMKRASAAEAECQKVRMNHSKSEEARIRMERRAREMEMYAQRLQYSLGDLQRRPLYSSHAILSDPAWSSQLALPLQGTLSYHQLMMSSGSHEDERMEYKPAAAAAQATQAQPMPNGVGPVQNGQANGGIPAQAPPQMQPAPPPFATSFQPPPPDPSAGQFMPADLRNIRAELEKSRNEYNEKTRSFKEKLAEFRAEIEGLKRDDRVVPSEHDQIHNQNVANGIDKYSTLRMSQSGSTKSRVKQLDNM